MNATDDKYISKKCVTIAVTNDLVTDRRVNKTALTLVNAGFSVTLIGRRFGNSPIPPQEPYRITRMPMWFKKKVWFYAEYNFRLFVKLLFIKTDIILSNDLDTLLACWLVSKLRRKKLVYDSHEYFTQVPELIGRLAQKVWLAIEQFIFPRLTHVYTVCSSISDLYSQMYGISVGVVRNVPLRSTYFEVLTTIAPPIKAHNKKIILYQGALNIGRGIEHIIEAMQYINGAVFVIVGDGDITHLLHEQTAKLGLQEKVIFVGRKPYQELAAYTRMANVGIALQEDLGLSYRYVLPNRLFDYIHAGIPSLVSNLPEMARIVKHYNIGIVTLSHEAVHLAQLLNQMLYDNTLHKAWNLALPMAQAELCWEREQEKLLHFFIA